MFHLEPKEGSGALLTPTLEQLDDVPVLGDACLDNIVRDVHLCLARDVHDVEGEHCGEGLAGQRPWLRLRLGAECWSPGGSMPWPCKGLDQSLLP